MGQVTRGYAAAATALLLLSGASSFGKCCVVSFSCRWRIIGISLRREELCQARWNECKLKWETKIFALNRIIPLKQTAVCRLWTSCRVRWGGSGRAHHVSADKCWQASYMEDIWELIEWLNSFCFAPIRKYYVLLDDFPHQCILFCRVDDRNVLTKVHYCSRYPCLMFFSQFISSPTIIIRSRQDCH